MSAADEIVAYIDGQPVPEPTECFAVPDAGHIVDCIHPLTGKTVCYGKTLEDVQKEYPGAVRMTIAAWCEQKATKQDSVVHWIETTAEKYDEMLCVLPPAFWNHAGFLVGEPSDHHALTGRPRYQAFTKFGDTYKQSSRPMTIREFKEMTQ